MMGMRPTTLLRYLHHARAVEAQEALHQANVQALPWLRGAAYTELVQRWQLQAGGYEAAQVDEQLQAERQARWDANWQRLRGMVGRRPTPGKRPPPVRLAPGERIVAPREQ